MSNRVIKILILIIVFFLLIGVINMSVLGSLKVIAKNVFGIQTGKKMYPGSGVENFGKVDENIYRGSYPDKKDYTYLKNKLGVKTVLDLTQDPEDWCQEIADKLGLKYINLPLSDTDYPTETQVAALEKIVLDESLYPIFHHCRGNRHRGGITTGIYRVKKYGWNYEQVFSEMKKFDWYDSFGHKPLRIFMKDYVEKNQK